MICSTSKKLDDQILTLFAKSPALSAEKVHQLLLAESKVYSIAAIYKALRALRDAGVLVKRSQLFSISHSWLIELSEFTRQSLTSANELFPELEEGGELRWSYGSLFHLNDAFSTQILALIKNAKRRKMYSWNPHPWFHLVQPEQEQKYLSALNKMNVSMIKRVGGSTALDYEIAREWHDSNIEVTFSDDNWNLKDTEYHVALPPFIVTARISKRTAENIADFFLTTKSISKVDLKDFRRVFHATSGRSQLIVKKDTVKSRALVSLII